MAAKVRYKATKTEVGKREVGGASSTAETGQRRWREGALLFIEFVNEGRRR